MRGCLRACLLWRSIGRREWLPGISLLLGSSRCRVGLLPWRTLLLAGRWRLFFGPFFLLLGLDRLVRGRDLLDLPCGLLRLRSFRRLVAARGLRLCRIGALGGGCLRSPGGCLVSLLVGPSGRFCWPGGWSSRGLVRSRRLGRSR